jgi:Xylanase inhibitor N-terminal
MGSATNSWIIFLVVVTFLGQASLSKSSSAFPTGFRATMFHRGYYHLSPVGDHYSVMINHSRSRLHYFGNVLTDKDYPVGYILSGAVDYIIKIGIGSPPSTFNLSVDTGSHITWVQHKDCVTCINKDAPSYDNKSSASAVKIPCDQPECDFEDRIIVCHQDTNKCSYDIWYSDGSESRGLMFLDSFIFSSIDRSAVVLERVRLGAGFDSTKGAYDPNNIQGVFGLSRNRRFIFHTRLLCISFIIIFF